MTDFAEATKPSSGGIYGDLIQDVLNQFAQSPIVGSDNDHDGE